MKLDSGRGCITVCTVILVVEVIWEFKGSMKEVVLESSLYCKCQFYKHCQLYFRIIVDNNILTSKLRKCHVKAKMQSPECAAVSTMFQANTIFSRLDHHLML